MKSMIDTGNNSLFYKQRLGSVWLNPEHDHDHVHGVRARAHVYAYARVHLEERPN